MKKAVIFFVLMAGCVLFPRSQIKPDEFMKNLVQAGKTVPVPERMKNGFESIAAGDLKNFLTFLSSDLLEGRETATGGFDIACEYAASFLAYWGVKPAGDPKRATRSPDMMNANEKGERPAPDRGYSQELAIREIRESEAAVLLEIKREGWQKVRSFVPDVDFICQSSVNGAVKAGVVFAGYGISEKEADYDDYKKIDVKGKIVMVLAEAPGKNNPASPFRQKELKRKYFTPPFPQMRMGHGRFSKVAQAAKMGALAVLLVSDPASENGDIYRNILDARTVNDERPVIPGRRRRLFLAQPAGKIPWESIPVISVSRAMADEILAPANQELSTLVKRIDASLKPLSLEIKDATITLENKIKETLTRSQNILGYVEGSDPRLKNEVLVIGAHLDHLGKRGDYIFNGADDNGSGAAGVMSLAHAVALNPQKPKRSILFALWTGEEEGLLGSRYYMENPYFSPEKTVAYLNMDMISRTFDEKTLIRFFRMMGMEPKGDEIRKIDLNNFLFLGFSADTSGLAETLKQADEYVGVDCYLRESRSASGPSGGSDHSSFALNKIPWVFFNAGLREDYHQPSDSVEKADLRLMEKVCRLVYCTAFLLADR
jgi:hypothetical protein